MSQDSMTSGWYYAKANAASGRETGPLSWEELFRLAEAGAIEPSDIVWNPMLPRGVSAGMIPELFPGRQVPQAPVVQPPPVPEPVAPATQQAPPIPEPAPQPMAPVPQPTPPLPVAKPSAPADEAAIVAAEGPGEAPVEAQESATPQEDLVDEPQETPRRGRSKKVREPRPQTSGNRLPALVLLLVTVIAAAGLAAYFLYFRDVGSQGSDRGDIRSEPPIVALVSGQPGYEPSFVR